MKSQRFLLIVVFCILAAILLASFCSQTDNEFTLATFKGGDVTVDEYVDYFLSSTRYKPDVMPDEENLKEIVTLKALEKIAVLEAMEQGIDKDSLYTESIENNLRKTLFYKYMRQEIIDSVITDSLIQVFYKNFTPQYHMSYILRPVVKSSSAEFEASQQDTINHVYRLLQSGRSFEDMASLYSQDITTKDKGGSLGFVIRESMGDAALRAAMDTLKDETWSTPIRGYEGFYILYKGEKRDVPVPPIEEVRDKIWQTLYRTRRHDIEKNLQQRFDELVTKYNFQVDEEHVIQLLTKAGWTVTASIVSQLDFDALENEMGTALATYDGGELKLYELFEEKNRAPGNKLEFDERMESISQRHLLSKHAMELGYQDAPDIKAKMTDVRESLLRSFLHRRNVIDKAKARMDAINEQSQRAGDKGDQDQFRRVTMERQVREEFEQALKQKYDFQVVPKNFDAAMKLAEEKKIEQNQERETSNVKREM